MHIVRPRFIPPCNPVPAKALPAGDAWLHEPTLDGYRLQIVKAGFEDGGALFQECEAMGLEGVVSKRRDAAYVSGMSKNWRKTKTQAWRRDNIERWRSFVERQR
jgi:ATP-dependent DNA ligase